MKGYMISYRLLNGLLLLVKLYPNSKAEPTDYGIDVTIEDKDRQNISDEDKQLLEDWGWRLTSYEYTDIWDW